MPRLSAQDERRLVVEFISGKTLDALAAKWELPYGTVRGILRRHNVTAADRSQSSASEPIDEEVRRGYEAVGNVELDEDDPFASAHWMVRLLAHSARQAIRDKSITAAQLRKELRETARTMATIFPQDAMADIKRQMDEEEERLKRGPGPEEEEASDESTGSPRRVRAPR